MRKLLGALAILLSGCAHQVVLTPRDGGPAGTGSASGSITSHGQLTVVLAGKTYSGPWTYMPSGSAVGFGFGAGGSATAIGVSGNGNGVVNLRAQTGETISCRFDYSEWSGTGVGGCQGSDGRVYDLQIHM